MILNIDTRRLPTNLRANGMEKNFQPRSSEQALSERLEKSGLRLTPQRQHIYGVLLSKRDHPTAEEVFMRSKPGMPEISLATVYNCLETLVQCGLVRLVNLDRAPTRYCSNMQEHHHFYCDTCGGTFDIELSAGHPAPQVSLPKGFQAGRYEVVVRGHCPECSNPRSKSHRHE